MEKGLTILRKDLIQASRLARRNYAAVKASEIWLVSQMLMVHVPFSGRYGPDIT